MARNIETTSGAAEGERRRHRNSGWTLSILAILVTIGFIGFTLYDAYLSDSGFNQIQTLDEQLEATQAKLQALKDEKIRLEDRIDRLQNDPAAVEAAAREQLGLIKPGDKVFIFEQDPSVPLPEAVNDSSEAATPRQQ